jgi:hypothetical protein
METVFFGDGVPWGALRVDDQLIGVATISGSPLTLAPGRHTVDYRAEPFPHLRCTISVPTAGSDTCPLFYSGTGQGILAATRMIDLGATLEALPVEQRFALMSAIDSALRDINSSATVAPGSHYAASGGAAMARAPLSATLVFTLNTDLGRGTPSDLPPDCISLCTSGVAFPRPNANWSLQVHALMRWVFTNAHGVSTYSDEMDVGLSASVHWDGTWLVEASAHGNAGDICQFAMHQLPPLLGGGASAAIGVSGSEDLADGCLITLHHDPGEGSSLPPKVALLLYRFGVLLSANDTAEQLFPRLPRASASERALAQQWLP